MLKKKNDNNIGRIFISLLEKKSSVYLEIDREGCKFLIEELTDFLNSSNDGFVDYDPDTGYDCGILAKNSLGIMIAYNNK